MRILTSFFAGMLAVAACAAEYSLEPVSKVETDSVLAEVNGMPITLMDVLLESTPDEARAYAVSAPGEVEEAILGIRRRTLEDVINRMLVIEDFRKRDYKVDLQQVESLLDRIALERGCTSRAGFDKLAKSYNTTVADLRRLAEEKVMMEMMIASLLFRKVNVTPREVHEHLEANLDRYTELERIRLAMLKISDARPDFDEAAADVAAILGGPDGADKFEAMVTLRADRQFAGSAGDLGWIERARLRQEFRNLVGDDPEVGRVYGPCDIPGEGRIYLKVTGLEDAKAPDRTALKERLRRELEDKQREKAVREYFRKLRSDAIVTYR